MAGGEAQWRCSDGAVRIFQLPLSARYRSREPEFGTCPKLSTKRRRDSRKSFRALEEAKKKSDDAVKKLIDAGLNGATVTLVCIGNKTAGRKFINYEIQKSIDRGNGIVGVPKSTI